MSFIFRESLTGGAPPAVHSVYYSCVYLMSHLWLLPQPVRTIPKLCVCVQIVLLSTLLFGCFTGLSVCPQVHAQGTCATQGTGLYEGLDWLSNELSKR